MEDASRVLSTVPDPRRRDPHMAEEVSRISEPESRLYNDKL